MKNFSYKIWNLTDFYPIKYKDNDKWLTDENPRTIRD